MAASLSPTPSLASSAASEQATLSAADLSKLLAFYGGPSGLQKSCIITRGSQSDWARLIPNTIDGQELVRRQQIINDGETSV